MCGTGVYLIEKTERSVDIQDIDNHKINDVPIVISGAVVQTQKGPVIVILHQYDYISHGKIIHSSGQLESFNCDVNEKSIKVKRMDYNISRLKKVLTYLFTLCLHYHM